MEVNKRASIKSIPYDEFKDNDTLEKIAQELNEGGANVVVGSLDAAINWGRSNSLWSLTFGTSCCGIEFMSVGCARYDFSRFGFEVTRRRAGDSAKHSGCQYRNGAQSPRNSSHKNIRHIDQPLCNPSCHQITRQNEEGNGQQGYGI